MFRRGLLWPLQNKLSFIQVRLFKFFEFLLHRFSDFFRRDFPCSDHLAEFGLHFRFGSGWPRLVTPVEGLPCFKCWHVIGKHFIAQLYAFIG